MADNHTAFVPCLTTTTLPRWATSGPSELDAFHRTVPFARSRPPLRVITIVDVAPTAWSLATQASTPSDVRTTAVCRPDSGLSASTMVVWSAATTSGGRSTRSLPAESPTTCSACTVPVAASISSTSSRPTLSTSTVRTATTVRPSALRPTVGRASHGVPLVNWPCHAVSPVPRSRAVTVPSGSATKARAPTIA